MYVPLSQGNGAQDPQGEPRCGTVQYTSVLAVHCSTALQGDMEVPWKLLHDRTEGGSSAVAAAARSSDSPVQVLASVEHWNLHVEAPPPFAAQTGASVSLASPQYGSPTPLTGLPPYVPLQVPGGGVTVGVTVGSTAGVTVGVSRVSSGVH